MSLLFLATAGPYLAPTIIAAYRDHREKTEIFWVNLLLGWTLRGWIVALVWACGGPPAKRAVAAAGDEIRPGGLKLQGRDPRGDGDPPSAATLRDGLPSADARV